MNFLTIIMNHLIVMTKNVKRLVATNKSASMRMKRKNSIHPTTNTMRIIIIVHHLIMIVNMNLPIMIMMIVDTNCLIAVQDLK